LSLFIRCEIIAALSSVSNTCQTQTQTQITCLRLLVIF